MDHRYSKRMRITPSIIKPLLVHAVFRIDPPVAPNLTRLMKYSKDQMHHRFEFSHRSIFWCSWPWAILFEEVIPVCFCSLPNSGGNNPPEAKSNKLYAIISYEEFLRRWPVQTKLCDYCPVRAHRTIYLVHCCSCHWPGISRIFASNCLRSSALLPHAHTSTQIYSETDFGQSDVRFESLQQCCMMALIVYIRSGNLCNLFGHLEPFGLHPTDRLFVLTEEILSTDLMYAPNLHHDDDQSSKLRQPYGSENTTIARVLLELSLLCPPTLELFESSLTLWVRTVASYLWLQLVQRMSALNSASSNSNCWQDNIRTQQASSPYASLYAINANISFFLALGPFVDISAPVGSLLRSITVRASHNLITAATAVQTFPSARQLNLRTSIGASRVAEVQWQ